MILPDDVGIAIVAANFEVAMVRGEPLIEYLDDIDPPIAQPQGSWRLFAFVPRIAFDGDAEQVTLRQSAPRSRAVEGAYPFRAA